MTTPRRGFRRAEDGGVAIYSALAITVVIGVGALSLDLGRYMNLHTELQHAADAAALAGAAELNGKKAAGGTLGARARAEAAAKSALFANRQSFATDGGAATVQVKSVEFFSELKAPSSDTAATSDADAHYIKVTVVDRSLESSLIAPVLGAGRTLSTAASAVAGMTEAVCNFPPFMICNPNEAYGAGAPFTIVPGQMIKLNSQGGSGSTWGPGMFSLLDPPVGGSTPKEVTHNLATSQPNGCYGQTVSVRPGQVASVHDGINTRFDIYDGPFMKNQQGKSEYRPARNVTKGRANTSKTKCDGAITIGKAFPLDSCFYTSSCDQGNRFGNANWDRAGYWATNHPSSSWPAGLAANASRYDTYRYEIDNGLIPNTSPSGENGNPSCYSGSTPVSDDPDRRVMDVAIVNCSGIGGNSSNVEVVAYAKMFLVRPMLDYADDPAHTDGNLYVEMIGKLDFGVDKPLRQLIQLYR